MQTHRKVKRSRRQCFGCGIVTSVAGNPFTVMCGSCRARVRDAQATAATALRSAAIRDADARRGELLAELPGACPTCAGTGTFDGFAPCDDCGGRGRARLAAAGGPPAAPAREALPGTGARAAAPPGGAAAGC